MFPPKPAASVEVAVQGLWESLNRAGPHWGAVQELDSTDESITFILQLVFPLPKETKQVIGEYIHGYMLGCGWRVRSLRIRKDHAEITVVSV
jgi:hypothetical protein